VSCDEAPAGGVLAKVWEFEGLVRAFRKKGLFRKKVRKNTEETRRNTRKGLPFFPSFLGTFSLSGYKPA
jgi:hypothetical protein